ncbi:MAG: bifunctional folylpolyglutamate synthase/dihydrofolate synthase [Thermoanaerobaculia bacterium]|nr:bifunctional folylpolyglutamate synthase/dihydrofolate synthase [Thermoanaerobaculia bacterium]
MRHTTSVQARLAALELFGMRFDLEPMQRLLRELDCEHPHFATAHVAGTNGKGSTAVFFSALAAAAGTRVGLYTSPHLETPRERLRIDGLSISEARFDDVVGRVLAAAGDESITYFEALTAAAVLWFSEEKVELAVLEVGLGGRLDATNAVSGQLVLFTPIDLDHTAILGETVAEIALEKAGVLRPGALVWSAQTKGPAAEVLEAEARRLGASLRVTRRSPNLPQGTDWRSTSYQLRNADLAVAAASQLDRLGFPRPSPEQIAAVLTSVRWPGRLERVEIPGQAPGSRPREVILDGAHNPAAARALVEAMSGREYDLLFGALGDKDVASILAILGARAHRVWLTQVPNKRAATLDEMSTLAASTEPPISIAGRCSDPAQAFDLALAALEDPEASDSGRCLLVAGSLFLVGAIREISTDRFGRPERAVDVAIYGSGAG